MSLSLIRFGGIILPIFSAIKLFKRQNYGAIAVTYCE